jgi:hypothetical protein
MFGGAGAACAGGAVIVTLLISWFNHRERVGIPIIPIGIVRNSNGA